MKKKEGRKESSEGYEGGKVARVNNLPIIPRFLRWKNNTASEWFSLRAGRN